MLFALIAILLVSPSYIHIFLPKNTVDYFFGYENYRVFWLAAGDPFNILILSVLALIAFNTNSEWTKKLFSYSIYAFLFTGVYFSIKPFIPRNDFPVVAYYLSLAVVSSFALFAVVKAIDAYKKFKGQKIKEIFQFLVVKTWSAEHGIIYKALMAGFKSGQKESIAFEEFEKDQDAWEEELDELIKKYG